MNDVYHPDFNKHLLGLAEIRKIESAAFKFLKDRVFSAMNSKTNRKNEMKTHTTPTNGPDKHTQQNPDNQKHRTEANAAQPPATAPAPARISTAWLSFTQKLTQVLTKLKKNQYLIVSIKHTNRFVQFAAQGASGMRVETTSNNYLPKQERFDARQITTLIALGWHGPTGTHAQSTKERDPNGSPNFFCDVSKPVPFEDLATLAVRTLTEVMRVPHPGALEHVGAGANGQAIEFPELGLRVEAGKQKLEGLRALSNKLLTTLKQQTGIDDLAYDNDGDIAIQHARTLVLARIIQDPGYVRFYSPILHGVDVGPMLFERLNDFNAYTRATRFVLQNGTVYAIADIAAVPFSSSHVVQAFEQFCIFVNEVEGPLRDEFSRID